MINDKRMFKELERLMHLPFPPSNEAGQDLWLAEYARMLRERVETPEHLVAIVNHAMNTLKRCPPPAELLEVALTVSVPTKTKAPLGCAACQGSGYVHFTKMVRIAGMDPYEADFAKPCDCALGQFIQPEYDKRRNRAPGSSEALG